MNRKAAVTILASEGLAQKVYYHFSKPTMYIAIFFQMKKSI